MCKVKAQGQHLARFVDFAYTVFEKYCILEANWKSEIGNHLVELFILLELPLVNFVFFFFVKFWS
jgi:hypothetical protein